MTTPRRSLLTLALVAAFVVVVNVAPAAALKLCSECDCTDPCTQACSLAKGGSSICDGFLCEDYPQCCNNIAGGGGNDNLNGTSECDWMWGYGGHDTMHGYGDDDVLYGGPGDDTLYGDDGDDILYGEGDDDTLYGGSGTDYLNGGTGHDTCSQGETYVSCND